MQSSERERTNMKDMHRSPHDRPHVKSRDAEAKLGIPSRISDRHSAEANKGSAFCPRGRVRETMTSHARSKSRSRTFREAAEGILRPARRKDAGSLRYPNLYRIYVRVCRDR